MTEEWGGGELELDGDGRKLSPVALVITRWKRRWIEQKEDFYSRAGDTRLLA